ncbi:MAG: non-canonical purine NTP pyrophosphatase [Candidatus Woesearchaeota archaeon]
MGIYFITGNRNKLEEVKSIFPEVESLSLDLPEIQELNAERIIEEKLKEASKFHSGELFCEDTSLYINCLNGLPGPLIKWFLQSLGNQGIYDLVKSHSDLRATAKTVIGYAGKGKIRFFSGEVQGSIVEPRGKTQFGWDPLFQPNGHIKTFAEMSREEKNEISMRREALEKLKEYLEKD